MLPPYSRRMNPEFLQVRVDSTKAYPYDSVRKKSIVSGSETSYHRLAFLRISWQDSETVIFCSLLSISNEISTTCDGELKRAKSRPLEKD